MGGLGVGIEGGGGGGGTFVRQDQLGWGCWD